ncbi:MAG: helix-turn-helix domain-containing protein [Rhizobiales bacterium]|nr:helix-turn-helix domain-containing protein [Hyphomicrobiales bacterium]
MAEIGDSILQGINEAIEYVNGDTSKSIVHTIINKQIDVKKIRDKLGLSQAKFSQTFAISLSTLQKWEAKTRNPDGAAKAYLLLIAEHPNMVKDTLENVA